MRLLISRLFLCSLSRSQQESTFRLSEDVSLKCIAIESEREEQEGRQRINKAKTSRRRYDRYVNMQIVPARNFHQASKMFFFTKEGWWWSFEIFIEKSDHYPWLHCWKSSIVRLKSPLPASFLIRPSRNSDVKTGAKEPRALQREFDMNDRRKINM